MVRGQGSMGLPIAARKAVGNIQLHSKVFEITELDRARSWGFHDARFVFDIKPPSQNL